MAIRGELWAAGTVSVALGCRVWVTVKAQGGDQLRHLPIALDLRNGRWAGSIPMAVQGSTMWPRRQHVTFRFVVRAILIMDPTTAFDLARWR